MQCSRIYRKKQIMYVARILYPVRVLGPGKRIGIWFCGCKHQCSGCSNPELWDFHECYHTTKNNVLWLINSIAQKYQVDGFTLTGGDPFEQPDSLRELLPELRKISEDIIVYSGYSYHELKRDCQDLLEQIAVLIDGPYIEELNHCSAMKGSDNQNIYILNKDYELFYGEYLKNVENEIQNFTVADGVISVGIHKADYPKQLDMLLAKRGFCLDE